MVREDNEEVEEGRRQRRSLALRQHGPRKCVFSLHNKLAKAPPPRTERTGSADSSPTQRRQSEGYGRAAVTDTQDIWVCPLLCALPLHINAHANSVQALAAHDESFAAATLCTCYGNEHALVCAQMFVLMCAKLQTVQISQGQRNNSSECRCCHTRRLSAAEHRRALRDSSRNHLFVRHQRDRKERKVYSAL